MAPTHGGQTASLRRPAQRKQRQCGRDEGAQRDHTMRSGEARQDEAVDTMLHAPSQLLGERAGVAAVSSLQIPEIRRAVTTVDDRRRVSQAYQHQVQDETPCASVTVEEGVNPLQTRMDLGEVGHRVDPRGRSVREGEPFVNLRRDVGPRRWRVAGPQWMNVMSPERPWAFMILLPRRW